MAPYSSEVGPAARNGNKHVWVSQNERGCSHVGEDNSVHLGANDAASESTEGNRGGGEREFHGEVEQISDAEKVGGVDIKPGRCSCGKRKMAYLTSARSCKNENWGCAVAIRWYEGYALVAPRDAARW